MPETELSDEFVGAGWAEIDLLDAFNVIETALDYMDEHGYF